MPTTLAPHKSGAHRTAALALFRALLAQCRAAPVPPVQRTQFLNILRNRFQATRHVTSHNRLRVYFAAGYEAIDRLDAAVAGDEQSSKYLTSLLALAPGWMKRSRRAGAGGNDAGARAAERDTAQDDGRTKINMFERPLPRAKLSGARRVPVLFTANWIPVLRFKKPQPQALSEYITSRVKKRQRRNDTKIRLEQELALAEREDQWDRLVDMNHDATTPSLPQTAWKTLKPAREPLWVDEIELSIADVDAALHAEREKNIVMAAKMQAVVDREQAALEEEKAARRAERKRGWEEKTGQQGIDPIPADDGPRLVEGERAMAQKIAELKQDRHDRVRAKKRRQWIVKNKKK